LSTKEGIEKARTLRKMLGGSMRQIGILAAAGLDAIANYEYIFKNDHENANNLYNKLKLIPEISLENVQTNILFFSLSNCNP
jgi:threonine aldolase